AGVRVPERDDLRAAGVDLGREDRGLHRLGPAVQEERALQVPRSDRRELAGGVHLVLRDVERGGVPESADLVPDPLHDLRVAVPDGGGQDPGEEVHVAAPVHRHHLHPLRLRDHDRLAVERSDRGEEVFGVRGADLVGAGGSGSAPGDCGGTGLRHGSGSPFGDGMAKPASAPCAARRPANRSRGPWRADGTRGPIGVSSAGNGCCRGRRAPVRSRTNAGRGVVLRRAGPGAATGCVATSRCGRETREESLPMRAIMTGAGRILRAAGLAVLALALAGCRGSAGSGPSFDVVETTIADIRAAMREGRLTARQLVEIYLDRIERYDRSGPTLNATTVVNPRALE